GDLGAVQTPGHLHLDSVSARAHGVLHRALHRPTERHPLYELMGDAVGDELRLDLGALHLFDVDRNLVGRQAPQLVTELIDLRAALTDHHARPCRMYGHNHLLRLALDLHFGERRMAQALLEVLTDLLVLDQKRREISLSVPAGLPGADDTEAKPSWMRFLSHGYSLRSTTIVTWLVRLTRGAARPIAAARKRRSRGPSLTYASRTYSSSASRKLPASSAFCWALATAERSTLVIGSVAAFLENFRIE